MSAKYFDNMGETLSGPGALEAFRLLRASKTHYLVGYSQSEVYQLKW